MAKATLKLATGAVVTLEGTPEEVQHLLDVYAGKASAARGLARRKRTPAKRARVAHKVAAATEDDSPDVNEIVNLVKNCDEAGAIEKNILDRASQVDRVLLPLYMVHEEKGNEFGL